VAASLAVDDANSKTAATTTNNKYDNDQLYVCTGQISGEKHDSSTTAAETDMNTNARRTTSLYTQRTSAGVVAAEWGQIPPAGEK